MITTIGYPATFYSNNKPTYTKPESKIETNLLLWVLEWERKVFGTFFIQGFQTRLNNFMMNYQSNENSRILNSEKLHNDIVSCLHSYHTRNQREVGIDRFIWKSMAVQILTKHDELLDSNQTTQRFASSCHLNKHLSVLLAMAYFLRIKSQLIGCLLSQIIECTGNMEFMFCLIPGLRSFGQFLKNRDPSSGRVGVGTSGIDYFQLLAPNPNINDKMLSEMYHISRDYWKFLISNLRPFCNCNSIHSYSNGLSFTEKLLNSPIGEGHCYSLLTLAIQFDDRELVQALVQRGAHLSTPVVNHMLDTYTGQEMSVKMLNSIAVSFAFRQRSGEDVTASYKQFCEQADFYLSLIKRSQFIPNVRKASNMWLDKDKTHSELNRDLADKWGIGLKPSCPSLLHSCRITIRQQLLNVDLATIPNGIESLPLPNKLKSYLNLLSN